LGHCIPICSPWCGLSFIQNTKTSTNPATIKKRV
jgi:hypothetical protein